MDTRSAAPSSPYPHQRRALIQKAPAQKPARSRGTPKLGSQTAGLDAGLLGAVNASRIAALSERRADETPQTGQAADDDVATAYRRTRAATTPNRLAPYSFPPLN